jgi:hypothetical protein
MVSTENLFCKIFTDTDVSDKAVLDKVSLIATGEVDQWTVITKWGVIDIVDNDDFDEMRRKENPDGFLFYRYCIELEPNESVTSQDYIGRVGKLLEGLWEEGWKAVAACDFEDELPRKGGYGV